MLASIHRLMNRQQRPSLFLDPLTNLSEVRAGLSRSLEMMSEMSTPGSSLTPVTFTALFCPQL